MWWWELCCLVLEESVLEPLPVVTVEGFSAGFRWAEFPCLEEDVTGCVAGLDSVAAGGTIILFRGLSLRPVESENIFMFGPCTTITGFATTIGVVLPARSLTIDG